MANELQHKDAGLTLTRVEDNAVDRHFCDGQVVGDIIYAQDGTVLRRLAVGANGDLLWLSGGLPAWKTPGIADNDPLAVDDAAAAAGKHARFTANGLEGIDLVSARAYQGAAQTLPNASTKVILLDTENYDTGADFDNRVLTANCDATQAFKLHDADGGFEAGDVGATIWNTTDNTYALVTGFVDAGELDIDTDIMVNGEGYKLFRSWFVCPANGTYLVIGSMGIAALLDAKVYYLEIHVNGTANSHSVQTTGVGAAPALITADIIDCSAADYIQLAGNQANGAVAALIAHVAITYLAVHRLS